MRPLGIHTHTHTLSRQHLSFASVTDVLDISFDGCSLLAACDISKANAVCLRFGCNFLLCDIKVQLHQANLCCLHGKADKAAKVPAAAAAAAHKQPNVPQSMQ